MTGLDDNKQLVAKDLETMALLLNESGLCQDVAPLYAAQEKCNKNSSADHWEYYLFNLILQSDIIPHTKPFGAEIYGIVLSMDLSGLYAKSNDFSNPLKKMQFDLEILGISADLVNLYAAWHIDKDSAGDEKFTHPEYHITFGGHRMWAPVNDYGQVIVLPSPRIAHPPMDAILGIDFVLKNYLTKKRHELLTQNSEYKKIVQNSIHRLWKPYYSFISNFWEDNINKSFSNFSIFSINPTLDIKPS